MLARVAADFYWMGRYVERTEHTGRLLQYQLNRLVDRPADELAIEWRAVYRALGQSPPGVSADPDEAETYLMVDAYTLAGSLVEEGSNPASMLSCWERTRENARHVRPQLPLPVWTCLNQGYLWMRDSDFAEAWSKGPAALVREAIDRLRLFAGVVDAVMYRDDAWRFLELGRFVERTQAQAALLDAWTEIGRGDQAASSLSWADLLRVCGAYEVYCRSRSMEVHREAVLHLLIRDPELPRSLRFAVQRIGEMLAGIDPVGARSPLAPPHRMALRLAAAIEVETTGAPAEGERDSSDFFRSIGNDSRALHDLTMAAYVDYSLAEGLPA